MCVYIYVQSDRPTLLRPSANRRACSPRQRSGVKNEDPGSGYHHHHQHHRCYISSTRQSGRAVAVTAAAAATWRNKSSDTSSDCCSWVTTTLLVLADMRYCLWRPLSGWYSVELLPLVWKEFEHDTRILQLLTWLACIILPEFKFGCTVYNSYTRLIVLCTMCTPCTIYYTRTMSNHLCTYIYYKIHIYTVVQYKISRTVYSVTRIWLTFYWITV